MKTRSSESNDFDIVSYLKSTDFSKSIGETRNKIEKKKGFTTEHDDLFFNLKMEKGGEPTTAIIRFFPAKFDPKKVENTGEKPVQILEIYRHFFPMNNGGFFVETCPATIGRQCPICKHIQPLWDDNEVNKSKYRRIKKKKYFFTNILVLQNLVEPEKEKNIYLFSPKKSIIDLIFQRIPEKDELLGTINKKTGEIYFNPFNPFKSANFRLNGFLEKTQIGNFSKDVPTYSGSGFMERINSLNEETFKKLYQKSYDLNSILEWDEYKIKDNDELKSIFEEGMGISIGTGKSISLSSSDNNSDGFAGVETIENEIDEIARKDTFDDKKLESEMEEEGIKFEDKNGDEDGDVDIEMKDILNGSGSDGDIDLVEYIK